MRTRNGSLSAPMKKVSAGEVPMRPMSAPAGPVGQRTARRHRGAIGVPRRAEGPVVAEADGAGDGERDDVARRDVDPGVRPSLRRRHRDHAASRPVVAHGTASRASLPSAHGDVVLVALLVFVVERVVADVVRPFTSEGGVGLVRRSAAVAAQVTASDAYLPWIGPISIGSGAISATVRGTLHVIEPDGAHLRQRDAQPVGRVVAGTDERLELDPSARDGDERPLDPAAALEHERVGVHRDRGGDRGEGEGKRKQPVLP